MLGIAIHFQMSFVDSAQERTYSASLSQVELFCQPSDATLPFTVTYVSLAVFVAAVTLALFLVV